MILGASFDTVEEQRQFADSEGFPYPLLSDTDHSVGRAYEVERPEGGPPYPLRISYLIDPEGRIAKAYDLEGHPDLSAHAAEVLADIESLSRARG